MSIPRKETGPLSGLQKRVRTLETLSRQESKKTLICGSVERDNTGRTSWFERLDELAREAERIQAQAEATSDHRTALLCIRMRCQISELMARLRGELDHFDSDTAKRIAETYLARLEKPEAK